VYNTSTGVQAGRQAVRPPHDRTKKNAMLSIQNKVRKGKKNNTIIIVIILNHIHIYPTVFITLKLSI
jgi:hypothetical protein